MWDVAFCRGRRLPTNRVDYRLARETWEVDKSHALHFKKSPSSSDHMTVHSVLFEMWAAQ